MFRSEELASLQVKRSPSLEKKEQHKDYTSMSAPGGPRK
jgi:hypothetical protein